MLTIITIFCGERMINGHFFLSGRRGRPADHLNGYVVAIGLAVLNRCSRYGLAGLFVSAPAVTLRQPNFQSKTLTSGQNFPFHPFAFAFLLLHILRNRNSRNSIGPIKNVIIKRSKQGKCYLLICGTERAGIYCRAYIRERTSPERRGALLPGKLAGPNSSR